MTRVLAVIGGSGLLESSLFASFEPRVVETPYGVAKLWFSTNTSTIFVQRHESSDGTYRAPHAINHRATIQALRAAGVTHILALASVGSLRPSIPVGTLVVPDDYYAPHTIPCFSDGKSGHCVPTLESAWRSTVVAAVKARAKGVQVSDQGTYVQTQGPRFETKAEVRTLALVGDVVGMTVAAEATLAQEAKIAYAVLCTVDNLAHGLADLSLASFRDAVQRHRVSMEMLVQQLLTDMMPVPTSTPREKADTIVCASYMVPVCGPTNVLESHAVVVRDGIIIGLGPSAGMCAAYAASEVVRLEHHALLPGLVNAHTHMGMTHLRGFADDLALLDWLHNHIWPAEGAFCGPSFVQAGTSLAAVEMIRSGTTTMNDMYFFTEHVAEVIDKAGLRGVMGCGCLEFPTNYAASPEEYLDKGRRARQRFAGHPRIQFSMAPHAPYTVSDKTLVEMNRQAAKEGLPLHIHLHETEEEVDASAHGRESTARHKSDTTMTPVANFERLGLLTSRLIAVHMTCLSDEDLDRVAQSGASVVHCPSSNLKLANGICRVSALLDRGVNVALGTDSSCSNNSLDMWEQMKLAALLAKSATRDPTTVDAMTALRMGTIHGARALGLQDKIGSLEVGKQADMIAVALSSPEMCPLYNVVSHLVYAASREHVSHVWVDGKALYKDGNVLSMDVPSVLRDAREWAERMAARVHHSHAASIHD